MKPDNLFFKMFNVLKSMTLPLLLSVGQWSHLSLLKKTPNSFIFLPTNSQTVCNNIHSFFLCKPLTKTCLHPNTSLPPHSTNLNCTYRHLSNTWTPKWINKLPMLDFCLPMIWDYQISSQYVLRLLLPQLPLPALPYCIF